MIPDELSKEQYSTNLRCKHWEHRFLVVDQPTCKFWWFSGINHQHTGLDIIIANDSSGRISTGLPTGTGQFHPRARAHSWSLLAFLGVDFTSLVCGVYQLRVSRKGGFYSPHDRSSASLCLGQDCDVGNKIVRPKRNIQNLEVAAWSL